MRLGAYRYLGTVCSGIYTSHIILKGVYIIICKYKQKKLHGRMPKTTKTRWRSGSVHCARQTIARYTNTTQITPLLYLQLQDHPILM